METTNHAMISSNSHRNTTEGRDGRGMEVKLKCYSRVLFWTFQKQYWWTFSGVLRSEKREQMIKAERCHTKKSQNDIPEGEWNLSHRGMVTALVM